MPVLEKDGYSRGESLACVACICVAAIVVFHQVGGFEFVTWDDDRMLYANPHVQGMTAEHLRWMFSDSSYNRLYMPLGWLGYAITVGMFGLAAGAHHWVNLALHVINAVLVFGIMLRLLRHVFGEKSGVTPRLLRVIACAIAIMWAVHPLRVEVAAWIGARVHGMAAMFAFFSLWAYLGYGERREHGGRKWTAYWASVVFYALSIFTFISALMLPGILFVLDIYVFGKGEGKGKGWWREVVLGKAPFAVMGLISTGVSLWGRTHTPLLDPSPSLAQFGFVSRLMQAFYVWGYFIYAQFVPLHLSSIYTRLYDFFPLQPIFITSAAVVAGVTVVGFLARRKHPSLWAAWLCHLLILTPFLGLTEHPFNASDRYSYLDGVVWNLVVGGVLIELWRLRTMERLRWMPAVVCGGMMFAWGILSFAQTEVWRNTETLFNHALAELGSDPFRAEVEWRLGTYYLNRGNPEDALLLFDTSLQITANDMTLYSKGQAILQIAAKEVPGENRDVLNLHAAECFDHVAADSQTVAPLNWAGYAYAMAGKLDAAEDRLKHAIEKDPSDAQARLFLANIYHQDNKFEMALKELDEAARRDPTLETTREEIAKGWAAAATSAPASDGR